MGGQNTRGPEMRPSPCHLMLVPPDEAAAVTDALWARLRQEAEEAYEREPKLASLFFDSILNQPSFEAAVFHRVAARLKNDTISLPLIVQAFGKAAEDDGCLVEAAKADISAVLERDPACNRLIEPFLYFKGFHAIQTHRLNHWLWHNGEKDFALYLQSRSSEVFQTDIHPAAKFGMGIFLDHATGLVVGETAEVGDDVSMLHHVTLGGSGKEFGRSPPEDPQRRRDRSRCCDFGKYRGRRACPCCRWLGGVEVCSGARHGGGGAGQGGADRGKR